MPISTNHLHLHQKQRNFRFLREAKQLILKRALNTKSAKLLKSLRLSDCRQKTSFFSHLPEIQLKFDIAQASATEPSRFFNVSQLLDLAIMRMKR